MVPELDINEILSMTEADFRSFYIDPAIKDKGWDKSNYRCEYYFTDGQILVAANHIHTQAKGKFADYYLFKDTLQNPLTIIEAKKATVNPDSDLVKGIQEAMEYGQMLDLAIVYASNGLKFREYDFITCQQRDFEMDEFPTPEELYERIKKERNITPEQEKAIDTPYFFNQSSHQPRYYQRIAINRTVEAVAKGQERILLVMATGTGKTFTAFQILWRLREAGLKKRILYLADRNILIDQTMVQDFKPFQSVMTKVQDKTMNSSYEIHMALYQQLVGTKEHPENAYEQFAPNFFDLVIVDECHRGSVKESSAWKQVLQYFNSATHIGLTATPKDAEGASNIDYFGEPIYTYSLKQGIEDGFLAPYTVTRSLINIDLTGFEPKPDDLLQLGSYDLKDWYNRKALGREVTVEMRQRVIAKRITDKMKEIGRMKKAIVFCPDIDEAGRMRDYLVDLNQDMMAKDSRYIMRITSDDHKEKKQLDNFIDPDSPYPVIVTTSELLSTGVDCKTCALIVIDKEIESTTQFKQIIGRGTRIYRYDEGGTLSDKLFFDILDFRGATDLFHDPGFDGPIGGEDGGEGGPTGGGGGPTGGGGGGTGGGGSPTPPPPPQPPRVKHKFKGHDIKIETEIVSVLGADGKTLEVKNIFDFTKSNIRKKYATLQDFILSWSEAKRKQAILDELAEYNVIVDAIKESKPELANMDTFDIICFVAFGQKPLTRQERANNVRKRNIFAKYSEPCQKVLDALLSKYADHGIGDLQDDATLANAPFTQIGNAVKIKKLFGGKEQYYQAIQELVEALYSA